LAEYIEKINKNYPEEVINYYSPNYGARILQRVDEF